MIRIITIVIDFFCFVLVLDYILHADKQIRTGAEVACVIGEQGIVNCTLEYLYTCNKILSTVIPLNVPLD